MEMQTENTRASQTAPSSKVKLLIEKLPHFLGELPKYQTSGSSGMDLRAAITEELVLKPLERRLIPTGLKMAVPQGYEIQVRPRSGLALKNGISILNSPGTVDSDYRGEVCVIIANLGAEHFTIHPQDRIAQIVVAPVIEATIETVESLDSTIRGAGGFGSTGRA